MSSGDIFRGAVDLLPAAAPERNPLRLVGWYARHPDAEPGATLIERFCHGLSQVLVALKLLRRDRQLWRAAFWPTALSLGGAALIAALWIWIDGPDEGASTHLHALRHFVAVFFTLASLPPTLLHPLWLDVARQARRAAGLPAGHEEPAHGYLRTVIGESTKGFRQAIIGGSIGLLPILAVLLLIPGHSLLDPVLIGAWALYWITLDAFEMPFELSGAPMPDRAPWFARLAFAAGEAGTWPGRRLVRRFGRWLHKMARPWRREIDFTEREAPGCVGFAVGIGMMLAVPVLGLVFRPVAIVAATTLASRDPHFRAADAGAPILEARPVLPAGGPQA